MKGPLMTLIYIMLITVGMYTLLLWAVGSHGNISFRPHMLEDWVLITVVLFCFGLPIRYLVLLNRNKHGRN
jgi:hypothetical protein